MSVASSDLVLYASADMPENNSAAAGGAIDSGVRVTFDDPSAASQLIVYSSSESDTSQSLILTGRDAVGSIVSESISLSGSSQKTSINTYERILKAQLSPAGVGIVTVSGNNYNKITDIPVGETGFRRPFYDATASLTVGKTYYDKFFVKNNHSSSALTSAAVIEVSSGQYDKITFALEDSKKSNQSVTNRTTAPTGVTGGFGSGSSGIIGGQLSAQDYQGVWLKLSLNAGQSDVNSFYQVQISGATA